MCSPPHDISDFYEFTEYNIFISIIGSSLQEKNKNKQKHISWKFDFDSLLFGKDYLLYLCNQAYYIMNPISFLKNK